jgi:hypothetical protein
VYYLLATGLDEDLRNVGKAVHDYADNNPEVQGWAILAGGAVGAIALALKLIGFLRGRNKAGGVPETRPVVAPVLIETGPDGTKVKVG